MLVANLFTFLMCFIGQCRGILIASNSEDNQQLIKCIIGILEKYFHKRQITYVTINDDYQQLLSALHSTTNFTVISRQSTHQMFVPNLAYLISAANVANFIKYFHYLIREPKWNPYVRFLIVIRSLQEQELRSVFNELLYHHVINVVVINGTEDAYLYAYNPFDNYACGKYYDSVINYGLCFQSTENLYPKKLITGLRHCNFTASVAHQPPYAIDPMRREDNITLLGSEEYIITLLGKLQNFTVNFVYNYDIENYSMIAPNMTAIGPMEMLQKNEVDIVFGGMMIVASRTEAFSYLCGYHDFNDELRFVVKRSSYMPIWKYVYMELELDVWAYLFIVFMIYSVLVLILLKTKDCGKVVLLLLVNLLLHGFHVQTRLSVKYILIIWVWFAYLINTFYQTNLFSFTIQPSMDFQVMTEEDLSKLAFKPCISYAVRNFLVSEKNEIVDVKYGAEKGCNNTAEVMDTVSSSNGVFTLVPSYYYLYNERQYMDKWGHSLIYRLDVPYTKFLFGYFFQKGFPITHDLEMNVLRLRESGLADKRIQDHYYVRKLNQKFFQKPFEARFVFPLYIYTTGIVTATVTFVLELSAKYTKCLCIVKERY